MAAYPTCRSRVTDPACTTHRPARASSVPGRSTNPSGSMPIRPAPWTVTPTWCATSHNRAAVRSTPPRPVPIPTCGAVIQPIAVSVISAASPLAAAAHAAMAPVTTSGRAGRAGTSAPAVSGVAGDGGSSGSRAGGASAETLTKPILATSFRPPKQARRPPSGKTRRRLAAPHDVSDQGGGLAGGLTDPDAGLLQRFLLGLGGARGTADDRAGVAHGLALRGGEAGHVAHRG